MRNYHTMTADERVVELDRLMDKKSKTGLSCREGGKFDYLRNVLMKPDYYAPKKAS